MHKRLIEDDLNRLRDKLLMMGGAAERAIALSTRSLIERDSELAERVIRDLAATGHQIIFTPSFGYMEPTLKVAQDFPQVKFESVTGYKTAYRLELARVIWKAIADAPVRRLEELARARLV